MKRLLQVLTFILTAIVMLYGCDSSGSTELNPSITDIQPESGPPGTEVTITGTDFSPNPNENGVSFGENTANILAATETEIEAEVPEGIEPDEYTVKVSTDGNTASITAFTVLTVLRDQIVFASDRDGDFEIFVMNEDGSNPEKITNNTYRDYAPVISNDGTKIAFTSDRTGRTELHVMNADGSDQQQITTSGMSNSFSETFSWSPDDSKIVFTNKDDAIEIINIDGSGKNVLTNDSFLNISPSWSSSGNQIVFISDRDEDGIDDREIFKMNADGTGIQQITDNNEFDSTPRWSPDDSKIVFSSSLNANLADIYIVNSDGTGVQRLTTFGGLDSNPSWSADGSEIVFQRSPVDIYKINSNGTGTVVNLTAYPSANDHTPFWSQVD